MVIAMVAEQRNINTLLKELFSTTGNQILLRPVSDYIQTNKEVCFYELMWIAKLRNQLLIGYKVILTINLSKYIL
jgi:hypothetical protein